MAERDPQIGKASRPTADSDFAAWIYDQAAALREGRFVDLDIDDIADEVESLAKRDFRALQSAIRLILLHMLKWDRQPGERGNSWRRSINAARKRVYSELASSPSFRRRVPEAIAFVYPGAREDASDETGVFLQLFPLTCPYTWEEIMTRPHDLAADKVPVDDGTDFQGDIPLDDDD
ncbi:DUF29 domain-containing protein [Sphingomonas bacterium]|uniref:DUF29 domain-containing protein n=1 Tax=Sphingomonas bacterium TaxID=1895847 RepID=UPI001575112B|nr:DUF29 domain-containing protein [Sphingomonas bacterium]